MHTHTYHISCKVESYNNIDNEEDGRGRILPVGLHHHIRVAMVDDGPIW